MDTLMAINWRKNKLRIHMSKKRGTMNAGYPPTRSPSPPHGVEEDPCPRRQTLRRQSRLLPLLHPPDEECRSDCIPRGVQSCCCRTCTANKQKRAGNIDLIMRP